MRDGNEKKDVRSKMLDVGKTENRIGIGEKSKSKCKSKKWIVSYQVTK